MCGQRDELMAWVGKHTYVGMLMYEYAKILSAKMRQMHRARAKVI